MDNIPRRNRIDLYTPAEKAIYDAIQAVEDVGADELLTESVCLLSDAQNKLADYIDREIERKRMEDIRHFNQLRPEEAEALALLAEECAETIQVIGKILRHGLHSRHPNGGPDNKELLTKELGDIEFAVSLCQRYEVCGFATEIEDSAHNKKRKVSQYLHHATVGD